MKISNRIANKRFVYLFVLALILFSSHNLIAQTPTISPTNGTSNCSDCTPADWMDGGGTPDISDANMAAGPGLGGTFGTQATWVQSPSDNSAIVLPLPPNGHANWLSLRDLGGAGTEESVNTTLNNLVAGRSYEVIAYSLTAVTDNDGGSGGYYAGTYNDLFTYQVGALAIQNVSPITINTWSTSRFPFTASNASETLIIRPGNNSAATGVSVAQSQLFETVQVSITLNAINTVPVADNNSASTVSSEPVTFNVVSTDIDYDGNIAVGTVDLDPSTPGIQNSVTTAQGQWAVNASGEVTFTPAQGFLGNATLDYTVMDDFVLDGVNQAATSNSATLTVTVTEAPSISVTKVAVVTDNDTSGSNSFGDTVTYTITLENTGDVTLNNITVNDILEDFNGNSLTITSGPTFITADAGSNATTLEAGDTSTFRVTYNIGQQAVDAGGINNNVNVDATSFGGASVSDSTDSPTVTVIPRNPSLRAVKTFTVADTNGDGTRGVDDTITYTIRITNNGNVTLTGVNFTDDLENFDNDTLTLTTGPTFINGTAGSPEGTLQVNETARYTATYRITQDDVDSGGIRNSVTAQGFGPSGASDTDVSDDGNNADGNTVDDPTVTVIPQDPSIEVTKSAALVDNGDGITGVDDTVTYTITIENTGNVRLQNISWIDTLQDLDGNPLSYTTGITFVEADQMSPEGELNVGETASYTATYTLTQSDVNSGGISNSLQGFAESLLSEEVNDVSDDGIDTDGNTVNDPTITEIVRNPNLEVIKTQSITDNGDGETGVDDIVSYSITIENTGNVDLTITSLNDVLSELDGDLSALTTGPTFLTASDGSPEGTLLVGEIATYTATFLIDQSAVDGGGISNTVIVNATGPDGAPISDISDDGNPADTDGDGNPDNDPTILEILPDPSIVVIKTADLTDNGDGVTGVDDVITYTITIENTGNVTVSNINLIDTLSDLGGNNLALTSGPTFVGADMGSSAFQVIAGETATYTATYVLTQDAVNAGGVSNTVTVNGQSPNGTPVSDVSDDGNPADTDGDTDPDNDPTVTTVAQDPMIEATKIATISDNGDGVLGVDDVVSYTILITNTGNVNLDNVSFTDTLEDLNGNSRSLDTGPTFVSNDMGSPEGELIVGETSTYTATYVIEQRDVNVGGIRNQVFAQGDSPLDVTVTDQSDDGDDLDGNTEDDPTETITPEFPSIEATKTFTFSDEDGDNELSAGDIITYTITVENTGNVIIDNVAIVDTLTDAEGNTLMLTTGPTYVAGDQGSPETILLVGETGTYTAVYVLTQSDIDAGGIINTVLASGNSPFGIPIDDVSDDGDDTDGNTEDDPTETLVEEEPSLEATKIADIVDNGDGFLGAGDTINYTITVENTGNVTLTSINLTDNLSNFDGDTLVLDSGPSFVSSDQGSVSGTLLPGETATYNASYTITQDDVNSGGISNSVVVNAETTQGTPTNDTSDDGDDTDGNTVNDPTETLFPSIEITKTFVVEDNGDGVLGPDDTIRYTILVQNTGTVAVTGVTLTDNVTDFNGNPRTLDSGPTFVNSDQGSTEGNLLPGETAEYTATYTIVVDDVVTGGVRNSVNGSATGPDGGTTNDTSDDGDDTDGNTQDDPTETPIPEVLSLEATKTANILDNGDGILGAGDTIEYTITVENTGNNILTNISLDDTITDFDGNVLTLTSGPTFNSTNLLGIEGILVPGEIATYTATYTITQSDVDTGGVSNTVIANGDSPLGGSTSDTSDDGDDTDGNTEDDPTDVIIPEILSLEVTKTASIFDETDGVGVGDVVTYTITVQNTGNVTVNSISITDTLTDFDGNVLSLDSGPTFDNNDGASAEGTLAPGETATYTATYTITQDDVDAGGISNSATASGTSSGGNPVDDVSDDGDDTDGNTEDDTTDTPIVEMVSLEVTKTATVFDDTDGIGAGDVITYEITVENNGNTTVNNIGLIDTLTDFLGGNLTLDSGPTLTGSTAGSTETMLLVDGVLTYTATYTITQSDVDAGGVSNTVTASGTGAGGTPVDDVSDDGDDTDGNTDDDPTETPIPENIILETTKTFTVTDDDGVLGAGDIINYTITVQNTGNVTVNGITIEDTLTNFAGDLLDIGTGPLFSSADMGSIEGTLLPGETATYIISYTITQNDVDSGGVRNTAIASGSGDSGSDVDDTSDDGDDTDGNTEDDPTETPIPEDPRLEVTKTFDITNNGNEVLGAGDVINYTIAVENTGNVTLNINNITDTIEDFLRNGLTLSTGPTFDSSSLNSPEGSIAPGETAFYVATYIITQADVEAGGVSNSVFVEADTENDTPVDDVSDDGDDTDGNTEDDPTETPIPEVESIEVTKIADVQDNGDGIVGVDDTITYTITIENNGNVDLTGLTFTDTLTDLLGEPLAFDNDSDPVFVSNSLGSDEGTLLVDEVSTYTATYTITQSDVDAGGVSNTVTASASDEDGDTTDDVSDDGDDTDGNTEDDPTDTITDDSYDLSITKVVDIAEPVVGDNVVFTITLTNDGVITAENIIVSDIIPSGYEFVSATTTAGVYSENDGNWTVEILSPGNIELLEITVEVLGIGDYLNTATIIDSDRGDDDDPSNDSDTAAVDPLCLTIYNEFSPNGDGVNDTFVIDCIERFPNGKLEIYNRWGNIVFETVGYENDWGGTSNGRAVVRENQDLPVGTYYYVLDLRDGSEPKAGWLYINR